MALQIGDDVLVQPKNGVSLRGYIRSVDYQKGECKVHIPSLGTYLGTFSLGEVSKWLSDAELSSIVDSQIVTMSTEALSSCAHKWVDYQPFRGESYICCSHASCGLRYSDWLASENKNQKDTLSDEAYGWLYADDRVLPSGLGGNQATPLKPKPAPQQGWTTWSKKHD